MNIILRRRPIKLGRAAQHMTNKGFVLMSDEDGRATWRNEDYYNDGRLGFAEPKHKRTTVIQLDGPNRHTGEVIEDHRGRMYIK